MRKTLVSFVLLACASLAVGIALPARAKAPMLSLGEVSLVDGVPAAYRALVTETLVAELAALGEKTSKEPFVIHARLANLRTEGNRPARSQCLVSLLVARQSGAIYATTQGKVTVEEGAPERAEMAAIKTAVKSAFARASAALAK